MYSTSSELTGTSCDEYTQKMGISGATAVFGNNLLNFEKLIQMKKTKKVINFLNIFPYVNRHLTSFKWITIM